MSNSSLPVKAKYDSLQKALETRASNFAQALGKEMDAQRFIRLALTQVQLNPKLLECDPASFVTAMMHAAALKLEPDGIRGHAYLIPFKGRVQLIPGYKGLRQLAYRSGLVEWITAEEIRLHDHFEYDKPRRVLSHRPAKGDRGEFVGAYAIAWLKGQERPLFHVMFRHELEQHRDRFAMQRVNGKVFGPWVDDFEAMCLKTCIRFLCDELPSGDEFADLGSALRLESATEQALTIHPDGTVEPFFADLSSLAPAKEEEKPEPANRVPPVTSGRATTPAEKPRQAAPPPQAQKQKAEPKPTTTAKPSAAPSEDAPAPASPDQALLEMALSLGLPKEVVCAFAGIEKFGDAMSQEGRDNLRGLCNAISNGEATVEEAIASCQA